MTKQNLLPEISYKVLQTRVNASVSSTIIYYSRRSLFLIMKPGNNQGVINCIVS